MPRSMELLDSFGRTLTPERRNEIARRGDDLVTAFRNELKAIKTEMVATARANSLQGLIDGFASVSPFGAPGGLETNSGPFTLANANTYVPITLNRVLLSYSYMCQGYFTTCVDQPVEDAFRGGIKIKSDELNEDDKKLLQTELKRIRGRKWSRRFARTSITSRTNYYAGNNLSNSDIRVAKKTATWARLFGGSGVLINTNQDFTKELDLDSITPESPLEFIDCDRWELILANMNVWDANNPTPFNYYGLPIHASRVIKMLGKEAPSFVRLRLQGWGMSELERCLRAINSYVKFDNLLFELLDEAKIDVFGIKDFNSSLASEVATERVRRAVQLNNELKNYNHALTMDAEDTYTQKQLAFTGLAEIREQLRFDLCAMLKMPYNKLFGQSATGFGGGQDAMENYNTIVEAVREDVEPIVTEMVCLRCLNIFGFIPDDIEIEWKPLRVLGAEEEEKVATSKTNRTCSLFDRNLLTGKETSEMLKGYDVLPIDSEVLNGLREVEPPVAQMGEDGEDGAKPSGKPAAFDRRKSD